MTTAPAAELLGGRYRLGPLLGRGGMADVHRATDTVLERDVAVKVFKPHVEDVDRTSSEVRLLASLNHPGLVSLYDAGSADGGAPWLVMELVHGPTLATCCLDGCLGPERVAAIGADLAEALAHCHSRGVVHRDVKPANVLLTPEDRAKLTDFGIARLVDGARHTATGLTVGTAPYFSPEQVRGTHVGPPSDVYSLGLVLLECLTGQREYVEPDPVACAVARLSRSPAVPHDLPAPWPDLLTRMTAPAPENRPDAAEVAQVLRAAAQPAAAVDSPPPTAVLASSPTAATSVLADADAAPTTTDRVAPAPTSEPPWWRGLTDRPLPPAVDRFRRHLGNDPFGQAVAAGLIVLLLLVVLVGAVVTGGGSGDSGGTPLERLEESVQP